MEETDADPVREAAEDMESQADEMEERSSRLGDHIDETRTDWEHKKADSSVPGALPEEARDERPAEAAGAEPDAGDKATGDQEGQGSPADDAGQ